MRSSYIELLSKIFLEFHKELKEEGHKLTELIEKTMVWLLGLCTGTIILLLSSPEKFTFLDKRSFSNVLLLLISSIIIGILGRICIVISTRISYNLNSLFDIKLKMNEIPYYPRELNGSETLDDIYQALQEDFQIEMKSLMEFRNLNPNVEKSTIDKVARDFYSAYSKWSKEDFEISFKKINAATIEAYGFKKDFFEKERKINNRKKGVAGRVLLDLCQIFYCISALLFISALLVLIYKFSK